MLQLLLACADGPEPVLEPRVVPQESATIPAFYGGVPSNVLLISIDSFRRDRAGRYAPGTMPFLEQIMNEGFTLDNHMTCANWTMMGISCSVNGRLNEENGFVPEHLDLRAPVPDGPTLASALGERHSILVSGNFWFSEEWNTDQGFDESVRIYGNAETIVGEALDLLALAEERGDTEGGWMVHAHVMEPHAPYAPPLDYLAGEAALEPIAWDLGGEDGNYLAGDAWPAMSAEEQSLVASHFEFRYGAELSWLDDQLAAIWSDLAARGRLHDTLVVLFNDHGEQLFDHGQESHAYALYGEENDGFAVFWSTGIAAGVWDGPTSQIDLAPTVLTLLGEDVPPEMTGVALGQASIDRPTFALTSARLGTIQSVRQSGWKLIYPWRTGDLELYDLAADPGERANLYRPEDPVALGLWNELLPHVLLAEPLVLDDVPVWPVGLTRELP